MSLVLQTTINPALLALTGSEMLESAPDYFCLPYHCPCTSVGRVCLKSMAEGDGSSSACSATHAENVRAKGMHSKGELCVDHSQTVVAFSEGDEDKSESDDSSSSRTLSPASEPCERSNADDYNNRDAVPSEPQGTLPNPRGKGTSTSYIGAAVALEVETHPASPELSARTPSPSPELVEGFNPNDWLNWDVPSEPSKTLPNPQGGDTSKTFIAVAVSPEVEAHPAPLHCSQPTLPEYANDAFDAPPSLPQASAEEVPFGPSSPQTLDLRQNTFVPPAQTVPTQTSHTQVTPGLVTWYNKVPQRTAAPSSQNQNTYSHHAGYAAPLPQRTISLPTHLRPQQNVSSVQSPASHSFVTYRLTQAAPAQQMTAASRPIPLHAPVPMRAFLPPPATMPNTRVTPAIQQIPTSATAPNIHHARHPPNAVPYIPYGNFSDRAPQTNPSSQGHMVPAVGHPVTAARVPNALAQQLLLRRAMEFQARAGSMRNNNVQQNIQRTVQGQPQPPVYVAQNTSASHGRVPKRSLEETEASDRADAENSRPTKRQQIHKFVPATKAAATHPHFPFIFPEQANDNHSTVPAMQPAPSQQSEAGPSTQMSDISNTVDAAQAAPKRRRRPLPNQLADYKRFIGSTYVCAWDGCGTMLDVGAYPGDRRAFEGAVVDHLTAHCPKPQGEDGKWHCRWHAEGSPPCIEVLKDLRAIIRHIYARHQTSKGKCENCSAEFARVEHANTHKCRGL